MEEGGRGTFPSLPQALYLYGIVCVTKEHNGILHPSGRLFTISLLPAAAAATGLWGGSLEDLGVLAKRLNWDCGWWGGTGSPLPHPLPSLPYYSLLTSLTPCIHTCHVSVIHHIYIYILFTHTLYTHCLTSY